MRVDRGISGRAGEVFIVFVGDVLAVLGSVLLGQAEVYHEDRVGLGIFAAQEVIWFYVAVDESLCMYVLYSV